MDIQLVTSVDALYGEQLTRTNMAPYFSKRSVVWEPKRYIATWHELENFDVRVNGKTAGVVRINHVKSTTYLRDLQLETMYRGLGIGQQCLRWVLEQAQNHQSTRLILKVYEDNPAKKLYQSFGFKPTSTTTTGLIEMELEVVQRK